MATKKKGEVCFFYKKDVFLMCIFVLLSYCIYVQKYHIQCYVFPNVFSFQTLNFWILLPPCESVSFGECANVHKFIFKVTTTAVVLL